MAKQHPPIPPNVKGKKITDQDAKKKIVELQKENEELKKKADADNTIKMIEKLNEELDELREEKDKEIKKWKTKYTDLRNKEEPVWNADIRVGAYSRGRFNESWLFMEDCFYLIQDAEYEITNQYKYYESMWKFNRRMEDFYECIMGVNTQDWCKNCDWLEDAKETFFEELQEAFNDVEGILIIHEGSDEETESSEEEEDEEEKKCNKCNIDLDHMRDGAECGDFRCNNCYWEDEEGEDSSNVIKPDYRKKEEQAKDEETEDEEQFRIENEVDEEEEKEDEEKINKCDFCDKPRCHLVKRDAGYDEWTCNECHKEQYAEEYE